MPTPDTIRASRLALNLTQSQAGALVGVTDRAWRYWEGGERVMPYAAWKVLQDEVERMEVKK